MRSGGKDGQGEDDICTMASLRRRGADDGTEFAQGRGEPGFAVPDPQSQTGLRDVRRHGGPHGARPEHRRDEIVRHLRPRRSTQFLRS